MKPPGCHSRIFESPEATDHLVKLEEVLACCSTISIIFRTGCWSITMCITPIYHRQVYRVYLGAVQESLECPGRCHCAQSTNWTRRYFGWLPQQLHCSRGGIMWDQWSALRINMDQWNILEYLGISWNILEYGRGGQH